MKANLVTDSITSLEINDDSCVYLFRDGLVNQVSGTEDIAEIVEYDDMLVTS